MSSAKLEKLVAALRANREHRPATLAEIRALERVVAERVPIPDGLAIEVVDAGGRPADRLSFAKHGNDGVLFYLHGGGYVMGSPFTHRALAARLSVATGLNALSLDYRLAPEHLFPAAIEDAVAAYRWLVESGTSPDRIVIAGDSAGGGLTLATLLSLRDAGDPLPRAAVLISPWTDLAVTGDSIVTCQDADPMIDARELGAHVKNYLGDVDPKTPLASPLYADLAGLPPLLIHVGTAEVLLDDSTRLAERAKDAGVDVSLHVYDDMIHVFHYFAGMIPQGDEAIEEIGQFVRARLSAGAPSA